MNVNYGDIGDVPPHWISDTRSTDLYIIPLFNKLNYYYESTFMGLKSNKCYRSLFGILTLYDYFLLFVLGVSCGFSINLPQTVEAVNGSCVFIPCTFDIDHKYENSLIDTVKRIWYKGETLVFDSSSPDTGLLKGEIFGTATQKNCTTRFDNVKQNHNGSYYFRLEDNGGLKYSYKEPNHSRVQIAVLGECYIVHIS